MAKKPDVFSQIMEELKEGIYKPVYILHGEEPYYIDEISNYIEQHALTEEERCFNQTVVYGVETSASEIADNARRFPMMADRQVVIVKEAQNVKGWEQMEAYLDNPQPTTVVVICHKHGKMDGRKKIVSKSAKLGVVFESAKLYDNELPLFISGYMGRKYPHLRMDDRAAMMLAEHIGADLSRLTSEIDKVVAALPEGATAITEQTVEQKVGISKDYNGFEFQQALIEHDVPKSMRIADYFAKDPKVKDSAYSMIGGLFSFFQNLMICYYMPMPKTDTNIAAHLGLKGSWHARRYVTAMRHYSAMKTLLIISKIRETDTRMKGLDNRSASAGDLLRELVYFILN